MIADFKTAARSSEPMEITNEIQLSSYAWLHRQITGQQEGGLEIRSLIKTKTPKVEFHPYPARTDVHFRRLFAVIREYLDALDRRTVQLSAGLRLRDVRLPRHALFPLGWIGRHSVLFLNLNE